MWQSISRSIPRNEAPLRISEMGYFIHEHDELSRRMVQDNLDVKSFSKCEACHQSAEQGSYDDDHNKALQLREMGEIMALEEILKHAKKEIDGRILELELEREDGIYLYEILILDAKGQLWEIELRVVLPSMAI